MSQNIPQPDYTAQHRPPLVLDQSGIAWSAVDHGTLIYSERLSVVSEYQADPDYSVRLERRNAGATWSHRISIEGARTLAMQLMKAAEATDERREADLPQDSADLVQERVQL